MVHAHALMTLAALLMCTSQSNERITRLLFKYSSARSPQAAHSQDMPGKLDTAGALSILGAESKIDFPTKHLLSDTSKEPLMKHLDQINGKPHSYHQASWSDLSHLQKRSLRDSSDLRLKGCREDHDPRIKVGITRGDWFMCYYTKFCPCDLNAEPEIDVRASGGILFSSSPCCFDQCSINFRIQAPIGQELLLEFLDMRISTVKGQNSDGSHLCFDSNMFFTDNNIGIDSAVTDLRLL